jgi:diketogulonate reductase-like aldo/keto reductase
MRNRDYETALKDLKKSLAKSNLEYFDLYLMHSAIGGPEVRKNVWRALVDAKAQGLVKSIGVSHPSSPSLEQGIH